MLTYRCIGTDMIIQEISDTVTIGSDDPHFRFIDGVRLVPRAEVRITTAALTDREHQLVEKWVRLGYIKAYANMTKEEYVLAAMRT